VPTTPEDDRRADFTARLEANMDALYGVALRLTRNAADAADLVAETVTRAWVAFDRLENRDRFRPWVFRILRNGFISDHRRRAVRPVESSWPDQFADEGDGDVASLLVEESDEFLDWWSNPEQRASDECLGEQIMAAIDNLPAAFRTTVLLINVDGLTYDEAAEVLGVPPGTVRSRMKRGRTLLQKALWQQARDAGLAAAARGFGEVQ
jgi:RNA polymerase sigma-70 factor (ECF subfamily)